MQDFGGTKRSDIRRVQSFNWQRLASSSHELDFIRRVLGIDMNHGTHVACPKTVLRQMAG
jgi:hypothetical protein